MLENRETMLQMFPELFSKIRVQSVSDYPDNLRRSLADCAPEQCSDRPTIAVLTPGINNSLISSIRSWQIKWVPSWSKAMI